MTTTQFIHIPKCAGNYVYSYFPNINRWKGHLPMTKNQIGNCNFTIVRNPIDFYISLYFFFKNDPVVNNNMKFIARRSKDINEFISVVIDGESLRSWYINNSISCNVNYDHVNDPQNKYGLFTNYLRYQCNPNKLSDIKDVYIFMKENIEIIKFETLQEELDALAEKYNIYRNTNIRGHKHNVSHKEPYIMTQNIIDLIHKKDGEAMVLLGYL